MITSSWKCGELTSRSNTPLHFAQLILEGAGTAIDNNHLFPYEKPHLMTNSLTKASSATSPKVAMFLLRPFIPKLSLPTTKSKNAKSEKAKRAKPKAKSEKLKSKSKKRKPELII